MLDLSLFRNPTFAGANTVMALVGLAMFGIFFFNSLFLQNVLGYSAIQTGATFLPMTLLIILVAPVAGRFTDRIGPRWLMVAGMTLLTGSLLLFGTLDAKSSFWDILPGLLVGGLGMAITMAPTTAAAMGSVPVDKAGVGSAVINSMRQVGGSLGIAIMGTVVATQRDRRARPAPATTLSSSTDTTERSRSALRSCSPAQSSPRRRSAGCAARSPQPSKQPRPRRH